MKIFAWRVSGRLLHVCTWALTAETGKRGGGRLLCSGRLLGVLRYMHTCKKCGDPKLHSEFYKLDEVHRRCRTLMVPTTYQRLLVDITIDDSNARLNSILLNTKSPTLLPTQLQFVDNVVVTICPLLSRLLLFTLCHSCNLFDWTLYHKVLCAGVQFVHAKVYSKPAWEGTRLVVH